jgi:hypothetical protein
VIPEWYTWSWKLLKYQTGGSKGFHTDIGPESFFPSPAYSKGENVDHYCRQGSVIIYLNTIDIQSGGSTRYYVQPCAGKCVIHPVILHNPSHELKSHTRTICVNNNGIVFTLYNACWWHESTTLLQGEKYILVGFMVDRRCLVGDFVYGSCGDIQPLTKL